ncbi:MAG: hypothetical protein ACLU0O_06165 [Collinsella sp.]
MGVMRDLVDDGNTWLLSTTIRACWRKPTIWSRWVPLPERRR